MKVQVKDFMSSPVVTAALTDTLSGARSVMMDKNIHAMPIVDSSTGEIVIKGIITASDLETKGNDDVTIEGVMSQMVHVIHESSSAKAAAKMMLKHNVHHLVVMDEGNITGIISSLDFVKLVEQYSLD